MVVEGHLRGLRRLSLAVQDAGEVHVVAADEETRIAKARHSAKAGWLLTAAGAVDVAASLSLAQPLFAVGALCFFAAGIVFFLRAAKLKRSAGR